MTFEARYPGPCGRCDNRITPGDQADYEDDELVHAECVDEPRREDDPDEACGKCWCYHEGECW